MNKKICRTNRLIQRFFYLQIASFFSPQRVEYFSPYSSLVSFDVTMVTPSRNCLDYEQNHCINDSDYLLVE